MAVLGLNDGQAIALIALAGPVIAGWFALKQKTNEKGKDENISRESHAWEENADLRSELKSCNEQLSLERTKYVEEHAMLLQARNEIKDMHKIGSTETVTTNQVKVTVIPPASVEGEDENRTGE